MNYELKIGIRENRTAFQPGEELEGAAGWKLTKTPKSVEVRLVWLTRGRGTEDASVVDRVVFEAPQTEEARPFRFRLPSVPHSFSGKLISLVWAVELVVGKEASRVEFTLAPGGREIVLGAVT